MQVRKFKKDLIQFVVDENSPPLLLRQPKRYVDCVRILGEELKKVWKNAIANDVRLLRERTKSKRRQAQREYQCRKRAKLGLMEANARVNGTLYRVSTGNPSLHGINKAIFTEKVVLEKKVSGIATCICVKDAKRFTVEVDRASSHCTIIPEIIFPCVPHIRRSF